MASAIVFVGIAFAIRYVLEVRIRDYSVFLLFAPAALLASWFGGLGAGILAFMAGLLLGDFYFLEPYYRFGPHRLEDMVQIASYSITTIIALGLIEVVQRSRKSAQRAAQETRLRNTQLEEEIARRKIVQAELEEAREQLRAHSENLEKLVAQRTSKLEQTVSALEGFCYTIAHDLRAPLRAMEGFSRALLEEYGKVLDATGIGYAERVCAAARRMDRLIQDLLGYERLTTIEVPTAPANLDTLIERTLIRFNSEVRDSNARVEIDQPLGMVRANPSLLEQVLEHLIGNAIKFSTSPDHQPLVRICSEKHGPLIRLWVEDNGIGIAPEYHARIFDPFVRLHGREAFPGNGIGLAFSKRAVQRMGGQIGVESAQGQGCRFWVDLHPGD